MSIQNAQLFYGWVVRVYIHEVEKGFLWLTFHISSIKLTSLYGMKIENVHRTLQFLIHRYQAITQLGRVLAYRTSYNQLHHINMGWDCNGVV